MTAQDLAEWIVGLLQLLTFMIPAVVGALVGG